MRARSRWVWGSVAIAIVTAGIGAWSFRNLIAEEWYLHRLESSDRSVQEQAARGLGRLRSKRAVKPLVTLLSEDNSSAWRDALTEIGTRGIVELLEASRTDQGKHVPVVGITFGAKPRPEDAPALVRALAMTARSPARSSSELDGHSDLMLRTIITSHLVSLERAAPSIEGDVVKLSGSSDPELRVAALSILRAMLDRPGKHLDLFIARLQDDDPRVRTEAAYTLGHFSSTLCDEASKSAGATTPVASRVSVELEKLLADDQSDVATTARWSLGRLRLVSRGEG